MERVRALAASVRVDASAWNDRVYEEIAAGRIDTALSAEAPPPALESEVLYEEDFVCLVGRALRVRTRRFTLKQYLELSHAVVETWGGQQTPVDRPLAELGLRRSAVLRVPFFVPTILTVARTDLILTLPRRLANIVTAIADVRVVEPPAPTFLCSALMDIVLPNGRIVRVAPGFNLAALAHVLRIAEQEHEQGPASP